MSSAVFLDRASITAGPGLHDLLKSLEESRNIKFTVSGRELEFRILGLESAENFREKSDGCPVEEWGIKALCSDEHVYEVLYNSKVRKGTLMRPRSFS